MTKSTHPTRDKPQRVSREVAQKLQCARDKHIVINQMYQSNQWKHESKMNETRGDEENKFKHKIYVALGRNLMFVKCKIRVKTNTDYLRQ